MSKSFGVGSIVTKVEADIRDFSKKMNSVRDTLSEIKKNGFGSTKVLGGTGAALAAVGTAGALAVNKVINSAGEFNDTMKQVQLMTGDTGEVIGEYGDSVRKLFREGLGSYEEIGKPFARARSYFKGTNEDIEDMTRKALQLQKAFGVDPEETLRAVSRMTTAFGIDGAKAYDVIMKTIQDGGGDPGDIVDAFKEFAHDYHTMGFNEEDMANSFIYGMQSGAYDVSQIGDVYREFVDKVKDYNPEMIEGITTLYGSKQVQTVMDNLRSGGEEAGKQMHDIFKRIGENPDLFMQRRLMDQFSGSPGTDMGSLFFENLEEMQNMTIEVAGAMENSWAAFSTDNLTLSVAQLKAAFQDLMTTVGLELLPTVLDFIQSLTKAINHLNDFLQKGDNRAVIAAWGLVIGTIIAYLLSAIAFIAMFWNMFSKQLIIGWGAVKGFVGRVVGIVKYIKHPIVLAVMAGIALIKIAYGLLKKMFSKEVADGYLKVIFPILFLKDLLIDILEFFTKHLPEGVRGFAEGFLEVIKFIINGAMMPLQMLSNFISGDSINPFKILWGNDKNQNITINTNNLDNTNAGSVGKRVASELKSQSHSSTI